MIGNCHKTNLSHRPRSNIAFPFRERSPTQRDVLFESCSGSFRHVFCLVGRVAACLGGRT